MPWCSRPTAPSRSRRPGRCRDSMLLAVVGATGKQGSSVIEAAVESREAITVRAVVRDARSPKASALAQRVAEIVEADLDDAETLAAAFAGADTAYCVTPPDSTGEWGRETQRARNMAAAARQAKLGHVVWSTQEDTRPVLDAAGSTIPVLGGRYRVPSYDAKADADVAFRELEVPTTCMRTSFYCRLPVRARRARRTPSGCGNREHVPVQARLRAGSSPLSRRRALAFVEPETEDVPGLALRRCDEDRVPTSAISLTEPHLSRGRRSGASPGRPRAHAPLRR